MTLRAVIYAHYSSDNQREASIEDQLRVCKDRITREGWTLVQVFRDAGISGATALRPGYQALLEGAQEAAFDVVVAEALDRLSRDQEDVAALYKRLRFAGIRIITLAEGEISELDVGLKGTMNALFLRDLAAKTHRGLRGRVEAGRSGGGNAYGYRVVRQLGADGQPVTGERQIEAAEAVVVERIFKAYAAGAAPKRIALGLSAEGIPGPRGGKWSASAIDGNRARSAGILNNELYAGRLVWNRLAYVKDPYTGRRRSRQRSEAERIATAVPDLRIVSDDLWEAVRARQAELDRHAGATDKHAPPPFWSKQRPRYLFSGLMQCGVCGGSFSKISAEHFDCSTARNKEDSTACSNLRTIRRDTLENTVIEGLRERLMDPVLFKTFAEEFVAKWNRLQGDSAAEQMARTAELHRVRQQIERLVDAIASGMPAAGVRDRLTTLEQRRISLEAELATAATPAPWLHPNLAEVYRQKVARLTAVLAEDGAGEARELLRGLINYITLHPEGYRQRVEIRGELAAILALAGGASHDKGAARSSALCEQIKLVAGTGFEPVTFRL